MSLWKKTVQRFTDKLQGLCGKRVEGDVSILIIVLVMIFFFCLLLKASYDEQRMYITYDSVDDSIVSALTGACTFNVEEYALGGQAVIYKTVTDIEAEEAPVPGETPEPLPPAEEAALAYQKAEDNLTDLELFQPVGDTYLQKSYDDFMRALKRNLKLDSSTMESSISGIEGPVTVLEFAVYNRFEQFDDDGNLLAYRVIKYSHNGSTWSVYPYNINAPVSVYNSYDKVSTPIDSTTVTAILSFNLRVSDYNAAYMPGMSEADMLQPVTYQRLVDIKRN